MSKHTESEVEMAMRCGITIVVTDRADLHSVGLLKIDEDTHYVTKDEALRLGEALIALASVLVREDELS